MVKAVTSNFGGLEKAEHYVRHHPQDYDALVALSRLYFEAERFLEAVDALQESERHDPLIKEFQIIQQAMGRRDYEKAKNIALGMLETKPGHPRAIFTLNHLYRLQGEHERSLEILGEGLVISPANTILRQDYVRACEDCGLFEKAVSEARKLIEVKKDALTCWIFLNVCLRYGLYSDLLDLLPEALSLAEGDPLKLSELNLVGGHAERIVGHRDDAVRLYQSSLNYFPQNGATWWALADLKTYKFTKDEQEQLRRISTRPDIHPQQKCQTLFALAKSYEGKHDLEQAMSVYHQANELHPANPFNAESFEKAIGRIINAFSLKTLSVQSNMVFKNMTPIFIVGLPRAGSTLIEQILASHSQVEGTLELLALPSVKREAHRICVQNYGGHYLDKIAWLQASTLEALGQSYLEKAEFFRKEKTPYFIDKLPHNFEHVGLIHKILPNAIIIDARRNPMDCGYSLYKQYFSAGSGFSYNLESIGAYYNGYLELMDHWDSLIPGKVVRLQYEALVRNPETQIRNLLDDMGLSFEESCLEFHKNERAVRTASSEQVRQPIYNNSIGAWRAVEGHLAPLKAGLGKDTLDRFKSYLGD